MSELKVLYYETPSSYAVRLLPKDKNHEITLYTGEVIGRKSLQDLITSFEEKAKLHGCVNVTERNYWRCNFVENADVLSIPVLKFNLEKNYPDMLGCTIQNGGYFVTKMYQRTALILDE